MLYWAVVFFIVALIAALFGFGGIATASVGIAQILFAVFLVLFIATVIASLIKSRNLKSHSRESTREVWRTDKTL